MKALVLFVSLLTCVAVTAQSPEASKYAQHQILLVNPASGTEAVLPMVITVDGAQQLQFVPVSRTKEFLDHGAKPIVLADLLLALSQATEKINQLQAENEKLWKVAMKDDQKPQTVAAQQQPVQQDNRLQRYLLLRSLLPSAPQPYQIPKPVQPVVINPNANRLQTNCIATRVGDSSFMNCN